MDVFDTNVWALGFTETHPVAAALVEEVRDDERSVELNAYIFCEVLDAIESADYVESRLVDATKSNFASFVANSIAVDAPGQDAVDACNLATVRRSDGALLIEALTGVEAKDAPVLACAFGNSRMGLGTTLVTADKSFSEFDPVAAGLHKLEMEFVEPLK